VLRDHKILITGPAGQIAFPMASRLAQDNEVWGIARFSEPGSRERVEAVGITTRVIDLAAGDFSSLPDDFTYLLHLATSQGPGLDYDAALRVNAEGTGLLLQHCRNARAALVTSTASVYKPNPDPDHRFVETDPLGDTNQPFSPTYPISKIAEEAVARTMARAVGLPVTIARINAAYGPNGGLPAYQLDWILAGKDVPLRAPGPTPYSPIFQNDLEAHVEGLLAAASVPATVVNWGGDEVVSTEDWCTFLSGLVGAEPKIVYQTYPNSIKGSIMDNAKRLTLTGPCRVSWRDGMRQMVQGRYPGLLEGTVSRDEAVATLAAAAAKLLGAFESGASPAGSPTESAPA
jgi:nucleoside-diphosphate-sugar epimerase